MPIKCEDKKGTQQWANTEYPTFKKNTFDTLKPFECRKAVQVYLNNRNLDIENRIFFGKCIQSFNEKTLGSRDNA